MRMTGRCSYRMPSTLGRPPNGNRSFVANLVAKGAIVSDSVRKAFLGVDRADFVRNVDFPYAYEDFPLSIGYGQTISQPSTVAFMLELLQTEPGNRVLDIGSGSGWTTALLGFLVGPAGSVTGLEIIPELVAFGRENLLSYPILHAEIFPATEWVVGLPLERFDRILVSAASSNSPKGLLEQLRPNGRLVLPVGDSVFLYSKNRFGKISFEEFQGFIFVPLRGEA